MDCEVLQNDSIEAGLAELSDAQRAGLFHPTRLDRSWLVDPGTTTASHRPGWLRFMSRGRTVAAAAVLFLAFTVWTGMFVWQLSSMRGVESATPLTLLEGRPSRTAQFVTCLDGPVADGKSECRDLDRDHDGDVDLADFGSLQIAYASATR